MAKSEELLAAHVAFELARFDDANLRASLAEELGAFYDWLRAAPVGALVNRRAALEVVRARLEAAETTAEGREFLEQFLRKTRVLLSSTHQRLDELLPSDLNERVLADVSGAERLRVELIRELVSSPIYTRIISEILFEGIKNFTLENNLARSLPGAQALFAFGQNLVSGMAPGLDKKFEANIKEFIAQHSRETLKNSEEILLRGLKPEYLRDAVGAAWDNWSQKSVADVIELLPPGEGGLADVLTGLWERVRRPLFENLCTLWIDLFLNRYGYRPAGLLLDEAGIRREDLLREGDLLLAPVLRKAREDGYLEARIADRLGAFYRSDAARKLLG